MKVIAKTTKPIMLIDPYTREYLETDPKLVRWTQFFEARTGKGEIEILASNLPDDASSGDFLDYLRDSDGQVDLAVSAFVSSFAHQVPEPEPAPVPVRKTRNRNAGA